jgi:hypothetical protein
MIYKKKQARGSVRRPAPLHPPPRKPAVRKGRNGTRARGGNQSGGGEGGEELVGRLGCSRCRHRPPHPLASHHHCPLRAWVGILCCSTRPLICESGATHRWACCYVRGSTSCTPYLTCLAFFLSLFLFHGAHSSCARDPNSLTSPGEVKGGQ